MLTFMVTVAPPSPPPPALLPSSVAVYCRISQDRTGAGLGVARQEQDCRAWAGRHGWIVGDVYADDDISAWSGKPRPRYRDLLADIESGCRDGLIIWHPDRLHRSPRELEDFIALLERHEIPIGSVTAGEIDLSTPTGRMTARIVGAVARHESDHKAERIRRKHLELAQNGQVPGGGQRPFGFEQDRVTIRESEAQLIREGAGRVLAGEGVRTVAADWNERGVSTVTGVRWAPTTVKRLLRSGRIAGWREHNGVLTAEAVWPAIIDLAMHRRLRAVLDDPSRARSVPTNARSYLLSGFVRCGHCGQEALRSNEEPIVAMTSRPVARKGHRYRRYACVKDRGGCNRVGIGAEPLEELIIEAVLQRLDGPGLAAELRRLDQASETLDGIDAEVEELEQRSAELAEMFAAGEISRTEWATARRPLQSNLLKAQQVQAKTARKQAVLPELAESGVLRAAWPDLSLDAKRAILDQVIAWIVIAPTTKDNNKFDPGRVNVRWRV
jgi:site-specific DNA recombinase